MLNLDSYKQKIASLCAQLPVGQLWLFGSVLTDKFAPNSDIDVLVAIDDKEDIDRFDVYFKLKENLEDIFDRTVDLVINKKFKNPVFRESLASTRKIIYERQG